MRSIPAIKSVMTPFPYSIEASGSTQRAGEMMDEYDVHHLPVVEQGQPIGVLALRDIGARSSTQQVGTICNRNVYIVDRYAPLDGVLENMANHRYESALVVRDGKLVGIFTITDACRYFSELLRTLFPRTDGNAA
jgi:acetoin utilization protein AcuB